ncbi:MAG: DinB family protein [Acidiferrobacteraceae bacterium]
MDLSDHYRLMADYNAWMNCSIYATCARIPDAQRKQDLGAFFRSIHQTLNHILWADRVWMARFTGEAFPIGKIGEDLFDDFVKLREERNYMDKRISGWTKGLQDGALERELAFPGVTDGRQRRGPLWCFASHLFNHQTHHRGQVTTLMMQLGYDPGVTDIPSMPGVAQVKR